MDNSSFKKIIGKVEANKRGTAFLVSNKLAVTARHVVIDICPNNIIEIEFPYIGEQCKANVLTLDCEEDIALLELINPINTHNLNYPDLCEFLPDEQDEYWSFGYPKDKSATGHPFEGKIQNKVEYDHPYDLDITYDKAKLQVEGASGSPLIINGVICGILVKNLKGNSLGALSFQKCTSFFKKNNLTVSSHRPLPKEEFLFLKRMIEIGKVGYGDNEELPYQETYATWEPLSNLRSSTQRQIQSIKSVPIKDLIEQYYSTEYTWDGKPRIMFTVADFGKGKSTFLKHKAKDLAKEYLETREGFVPIYFNLRDYKSLNSEECIKDYLNGFGIDLDNNFLNKQIFFLIDSLDESGPFVEKHMHEVMQSIKKTIRNRMGKRLKDRIIVTSRPIPGILENLISLNKPYKDENEREFFALLYGFTEEQFDNYLFKLKDKLIYSKTSSLNHEIIERIKNGESVGDFLITRGFIESDEIRRPIFAYMLYKLLAENYEITKGDRLGICLSFINLLTQEAKHIKEIRENTNLLSQLKHRNILYATAIVWMINRLDRESSGYLSAKNLSNIVGDEGTSYKFLSHSFFGETHKQFYFHHQSFAEILMAEYYIRVFLYFGFQDKPNIVEMRKLLNLGEPTPQTMNFLKGLLKMLFKATANTDTDTIESILINRRLFFPILASLGIEEYNNLEYFFVPSIKAHYEQLGWDHEKDISNNLLNSWPIDLQMLERIFSLTKEILGEPDDYISIPNKQVATPYHDLLVFQDIWQTGAPDIERWIALFTGEYIAKFLEKDYYEEKDHQSILRLVRNWSRYNNMITPSWVNTITGWKFTPVQEQEPDALPGVSFVETSLQGATLFEAMNLKGAEFTWANLNNISFYKAKLQGSSFQDTTIQDVDFQGATLTGSYFIGGILKDISFKRSNLKGAYFHECVFYDVDFTDADMEGIEISACTLINPIGFEKAKLYGSRLEFYIDDISEKSFIQKVKHIRAYKNFHSIPHQEAIDHFKARKRSLSERFKS